MSDNYQVFNINETDLTNNDIIVTITPMENIVKYSYTIIKNNEILETTNILTNENASVLLDTTGNYQIEVVFYDNRLKETVVTSGIYKIDKEKPIINLDKNMLEIKVGDTIDVYENIKAYDEVDGDLTSVISSNYDTLDMKQTGIKKLEYYVQDKAGNVATSTLNINVLPNYKGQIFFFNVLVMSFILLLSLMFIRYKKSIKLEKRIAKYTIDPLNDKSLSIFDKFFNNYHKLILKLSTPFEKSVFITKYSKHYEKYIGIVNKNFTKEMEFVVSKFFVGIIFLLIAIFSKTVQSKVLSLYEIIIPLTVGFFIPDIIYFSKYKVYRAKLENDMLQAIIIMNNAFKSGRSITQAIDLVSTELEGPIAEEFKKMSLELSFGLGIEDVFKRFSKRIELEQVNYLTASLTVLNKTGGNIIKVFSSIEKTLFNQKKLKIELASLTGASKIIVYILFVVPILFVAFISVVDPTYFVPLLTTPLGLILSFIIIIVYIIYIIVVRKVMKVRM